MRILYWQWNSFLGKGIEEAFRKLKINYKVFLYPLSDWEADGVFQQQLGNQLEGCDMVFSVNYNPLITEVCARNNKPYLSWTYDSPIHIRNLEPLKNVWNRAYFFDRGFVEEMQKQGIPVRYLPLAASPAVFRSGKSPSLALGGKCGSSNRNIISQIALVGNLYQNDYSYYMGPLDNYLRGYLEGIVRSQLNLYGGYILPELVTEDLLQKMNAKYLQASNEKVTINARELEYLLAQEVTGRERLLALKLLSEHFETKVYSSQKDERLSKVIWMGYADYYTEMPRIFSQSKINLNITLKTIRTGIPLRILDVLSCGGFLITNYQAELSEYFRIGKELVVYQDMEELLYLTEYYLTHENERRQIAENGRQRIEKDFKFEDKIQKMLDEI